MASSLIAENPQKQNFRNRGCRASRENCFRPFPIKYKEGVKHCDESDQSRSHCELFMVWRDKAQTRGVKFEENLVRQRCFKGLNNLRKSQQHK